MTVKKVTAAKKLPTVKVDENSESKRSAMAVIKSTTICAAVIEPYAKGIITDVELGALAVELGDKIKEVQAGDMASIESMLIGQAQALQTIFASLARKAIVQPQLNQYNTFLTLALKAQSQSRATIQALTELKYPKQVSFVKQANITTGNQQVNNGTLCTNTHAHTGKTINQSNELLTKDNHATLDTRRKATTSRTNQNMEAVESLNRGKDN